MTDFHPSGVAGIAGVSRVGPVDASAGTGFRDCSGLPGRS